MLGSRIADLRQKAGLSQAALAARINVSTSAVGMYEQGRREPSMSILICIAKELGVSTDYLLDMPAKKTDDRMFGASVYGLCNAVPATLLLEPSKLLTREELAVLCLACLL